ncbi:hypothetical protein [Enterococcus sp. LJL90]
MKKVLLGLVLFSGLVLSGCGSNEGGGSSSNTSSSSTSTTEASSSETNDSSTESSSELVTIKSGDLEFSFETVYDKSQIGYDWDYYPAKLEAMQEQAPDEYADFQFIITSLESFYPESIFYLNDSEATEEEKNEERVDIEANIIKANSIKEKLSQIDRTNNNADEYILLESRIDEALANEAYLN